MSLSYVFIHSPHTLFMPRKCHYLIAPLLLGPLSLLLWGQSLVVSPNAAASQSLEHRASLDAMRLGWVNSTFNASVNTVSDTSYEKNISQPLKEVQSDKEAVFEETIVFVEKRGNHSESIGRQGGRPSKTLLTADKPGKPYIILV